MNIHTPHVYGDNNSLHFYGLFNLKTLNTFGPTAAGGFPIFTTFYLFFPYTAFPISPPLYPSIFKGGNQYWRS